MKLPNRVSVAWSLLGLAACGLLTQCSNEKLIPLVRLAENRTSTLTVKGSFCTLKPAQFDIPLKFLFILDESGSNHETDPNGTQRFGAIERYLASPPGQGKDYYAAITFSDAPTVVSPFTEDRSAFLNLIKQEDANRTDNGGTNYVDTLGRALQLISQDIQAQQALPNPQASDYIIFFISDGMPTVGGTTAQEILPAVKALRDLESTYPQYVDEVSLNTGHYYVNQPDPVAESLMQQMANTGGGQFFEFSQSQNLDFNRFAVPTSRVKHVYKDLVVRNINTVWEGDLLRPDADGDGLSDERELQYGSHPDQTDSDGNGVSDLVEFRIRGTPCLDGSCSAANSAIFPNCSDLRSPDGSYPDSDGDGLNDCEERLLKSDYKDFDSNGDWIPDGIAFRDEMAFLKDTYDYFLDPDGDGLNDYQELKAHTPQRFPNDKVIGLHTSKYSLDVLSDDDQQTCYSAEITDVASLSDHDHIWIQVMEFTPDVKERRYLRTAILPESSDVVTFSDSDLKLPAVTD